MFFDTHTHLGSRQFDADLPVVLVHPGGFDIMGSLASAQAERKAVVTYGEMPLELMEFVQRFDLPVELRSYRSEADARSCVQDLKELGVEWVLAPGLVVDLAREIKRLCVAGAFHCRAANCGRMTSRSNCSRMSKSG